MIMIYNIINSNNIINSHPDPLYDNENSYEEDNVLDSEEEK